MEAAACASFVTAENTTLKTQEYKDTNTGSGMQGKTDNENSSDSDCGEAKVFAEPTSVFCLLFSILNATLLAAAATTTSHYL